MPTSANRWCPYFKLYVTLSSTNVCVTQFVELLHCKSVTYIVTLHSVPNICDEQYSGFTETYLWNNLLWAVIAAEAAYHLQNSELLTGGTHMGT